MMKSNKNNGWLPLKINTNTLFINLNLIANYSPLPIFSSAMIVSWAWDSDEVESLLIATVPRKFRKA